MRSIGEMPRSSHAVLFSLAAVIAACNDPHDEDGSDDATQSECPKLSQRGPDGCSPVLVTSISSEDFEFERDGWVLRGTLFTPETSGDYSPPGAVVFHGSGPLGRRGLVEGSIGVAYEQPIPVYESLAEQLAWAGFAVLTYDKRSCFVENSMECEMPVSEYPGDPNDILISDFVEDGRAAAVALHTYLNSDVLLVGHSQGALFVPELAQEEFACGAVMLAGAVLDLPTTVSRQYGDYADYIESVDPGNPVVEELRMLEEEALVALEQIDSGTYPADSWNGASVEFWKSWMDWQAQLRDSLEMVDVPVLAAFAGFDFNVGTAHERTMREWQAAGVLAKGVVLNYPEHTHVFAPLVEESPGYEATFSPLVVADIVEWASQP